MNFDAHELIHRGIESDELDYKAAMNWNKMPRAAKAKLLRHCLAFANTKGGCIVIGVAEDASGRPIVRTGLSAEESHSFDPSSIITFINHYAEPPIDLAVERPTVDGRRYAVIVIKPFREVPHVCANSLNGELMQGVFYIRTKEASSRPAYRAAELHEIVRRALRNQRELLGRMLRGLLYESRAIPGKESAAVEDQRDHAMRFFLSRKPQAAAADSRIIQLSMAPDDSRSGRYSLSELRRALERAHRGGNDWLAKPEVDAAYFTNTSLRSLPENGRHMWQLFTDGFFHYVKYEEHAEKSIDLAALASETAAALPFLGRLADELGMVDEMLALRLDISNVENCRLRFGRTDTDYISHIPEVEVTLHRSAADLVSGAPAHAGRLIRETAERFNLPEHEMKRLDF